MKRVEAAKRAYFEVGGFWTKAGIPMRWRRCMFGCRVVNAALSGVECFLVSSGQLHKLEMAVAALARKALRGNAAWEEEGGTRCLSSEEVLRVWNVPPSRWSCVFAG